MSRVDVRDLAGQSLHREAFPTEPRSDYRLHFGPAARQKMHDHAEADTSVEICGVLVGRFCEDENGPFAVVENAICCNSAASKFAEVTFTHESWAQINEEMDTEFAGKQIVGWYHSHPNFGVFLSDRDLFIHEHFFSGPGQVAYVIDPIRQEEGVFVWRDGKAKILPHYWVGETIHPSTPHDESRPPTNAADPAIQDAEPYQPRAAEAREPWYYSLLPLLLAGLLAFFLGTLYGGLKSNWERARIVDGVIANYGNSKFAKIGLQEDLGVVVDRLKELFEAIQQTPVGPDGEAPTERDLARRQRMIRGGFRESVNALRQIGDRYGYDEFERQAIARYAAEQQAGLKRITLPPRRLGDPVPPRPNEARRIEPPAASPSETQPNNQSSEAKEEENAPVDAEGVGEETATLEPSEL